MQDTESDFHREAIGALLRNELRAPSGRWSMQGFGMARLYLSTDRSVRLNIWHSALLAPGLTPATGMMHTHPWDFTSRIIAGQLTNVRYNHTSTGDPYVCAVITPGPGGDFTDAEGFATKPSGWEERDFVTLMAGRPEVYGPGDSYHQDFNEIHHTEYVDGTITINRRDRGDRPDLAVTYWRTGETWISAEPRDATHDALMTTLSAARELLVAS